MSNEQKENDKAMQEFQKAADFLNQAFQEGVAAATMLFIKKHKMKTEKGALGLDTTWVFAQHLNAEYPPDTEDGKAHKLTYPYPFKKSLRERLDPVIRNEAGTLLMLMKHEEMETIRKLCHIIAAGVVLNFLDENDKEVIEFYEGLKAKKDNPK